MVPLTPLWLPILFSAVIVLVASSIIHMVLSYHRKDYRPVPAEDAVMEALRRFSIPPGDYLMPCPTGPHALKDSGPALSTSPKPAATGPPTPTTHANFQFQAPRPPR